MEIGACVVPKYLVKKVPRKFFFSYVKNLTGSINPLWCVLH